MTTINNSNSNSNSNDKKSQIVSSLLLKASSLKQEGNNHFSEQQDYAAAHDSYSHAIRIIQQILVYFTSNNNNNNNADDDIKTLPRRQGAASNISSIQEMSHRQEAIQLYINLIGNNSLVLYKLARYSETIKNCNCIIQDSTISRNPTAVVVHDGDNSDDLHLNLSPAANDSNYDLTKIYYRRGLAREALRQYHSAKNDIQTCIELGNINGGNSSSSNGAINSNGNSNSNININKNINSNNNSSSNSNRNKAQQDAKRVLMRIQARINTQQRKQRIQSSSKSMHRCPPPDQQREIILALLLQSNNTRTGESFFIVDFKWWTRWCHYVDFVSLPKHILDSLIYTIPKKDEKNRGTKMDIDGNDDSPSDDDDDIDNDNDDSSSSEEESDDDFYCQGFGELPGVINNSKLILFPLFDNNDQDDRSNAVDLLQQEWSWRIRQVTHTPTTNAIASNHIVLKPQLVRGYHFEILPREVYSTLKLWYGESSPSIVKRAMLLDTNQQANAKISSASTTNVQINSQISVVLYDNDNPIGINTDSKRQELYQKYDPNSGRVGLNNLGNTCFMNSALQCLSHATPLSRYFLTNQYKADINTTNPIGTGGKLAAAYETMIRALWMSKKRQTSVSPRALKRAIALFAPRFAGTSQQDSQEFLAFLLDGLHEDLNRVRNPPYIEKADVTHEHDLNVAAVEAWDAHRKRNQSIVMDTFYGQFKSTCVCPNCKKISVSFDVFNHVSLEIPQLSSLGKRIVPIILFRASLPSKPPMRYGISVPKHATMGDIKLQLSSLSQIPASGLAICDIYQSSLYEIIRDGKNISALNNDDVIVAYEIDPYTSSVMHTIAGHVIIGGNTGKTSIGYPLFTSFSINLSCRQVIQHFQSRLAYLAPEGAAFQVSLTDSSGHPNQAFVDPLSDSLSAIVPDSDAAFTSFLKEDCSESFIFVALNWSFKEPIANTNFCTFLDHPSLNEAIAKHRLAPNRLLTLDQCLDNFTHPERLDEDNKWFCSTCKNHVRAEKTMTLWRLPNILVIHLKRFEFRNALRREKLDTHVDFPLEGLDMNKYCALSSTISKDGEDFVMDDVPAIYDLFGVVNHYGRMGFGHYTAVARRWNEYIMEDDWKLFDDSCVSDNVTNADVVSNAGYLLFYRRREFA